jgi:hypothetical protein
VTVPNEPHRGRRHVLAWILALGIVLLSAACGSAALPGATVAAPKPSATLAAGKLRLLKIGTFPSPLYVTGAPGDMKRVFVVEKAGKIALLAGGHQTTKPFLNITSVVNSTGEEQGLLSMAFAPDYQTSGRFYVDDTGSNGDIHLVQYNRSGGETAGDLGVRPAQPLSILV